MFSSLFSFSPFPLSANHINSFMKTNTIFCPQSNLSAQPKILLQHCAITQAVHHALKIGLAEISETQFWCNHSWWACKDKRLFVNWLAASTITAKMSESSYDTAFAGPLWYCQGPGAQRKCINWTVAVQQKTIVFFFYRKKSRGLCSNTLFFFPTILSCLPPPIFHPHSPSGRAIYRYLQLIVYLCHHGVRFFDIVTQNVVV